MGFIQFLYRNHIVIDFGILKTVFCTVFVSNFISDMQTHLTLIYRYQCVKSVCTTCTYAHQKIFVHILRHQKCAHFAYRNFYFCTFSAQ